MTKIENRYLDNQNDWNEINGLHKANAVMWRTIAFISNFITVLAVCGMIYAASLPDIVPVVYREDASGGLTLVGIPNKALKADNGMISNQLRGYIQALREVPLSNALRQRNVHTVKVMTLNTLFSAQIAPMMRDEYANIGMSEQLILIRSAMPISKNIWQVEWDETKDGKKIGRYKANIEFTTLQGSFKDPDERMYNPLGIRITDFNLSSVVGG